MLDGIKQWDSNKIMQWFSNDVAKDILEVPLIDVVKEDSMVWREEQHDQQGSGSSYASRLSRTSKYH
jgi:hypothetical protein